MLLHRLLLFLFPLLPDRAVIYTAQPSDSFLLLYEIVFIPWDIWTENQRPRVRTRDIPSVPSSARLSVLSEIFEQLPVLLQ